jgi:protein TonB
MTGYERSSFIVAAVISITVHATAAVYLGHYPAPFADQPQSAARAMQISLAPTRPAAPQPEPEPESKPIPPPKPEPEPPPPPRKPVSKPAPKREPLPKPEPVIEQVPVSNEEPETTEPVEEQTASSAYTEALVDKPALDQIALGNERESYLLRMLAHIDRHKYYPRKARRRGMEGEIKIVFHLHKDGSISELQVSGGSKVLRRAAKQAVQKALSLPSPPESMQLQEQIRFGMVYRLDG